MISFFSHLQCSHCGEFLDPEKVQTFCTKCQTPLLARYDLASVRKHVDRDEIRHRPKGMWRWHELLPVFDAKNIVSLGEGDAPLLPLPNFGGLLGLEQLYVKDESFNPTGSFKARGISAAISKARELNIDKVIIPTAGNAGGAMAAYAARAGLKAHIFMPKDTPHANMEECRMAGADLTLIDGLISEAAGMAGVKAREEGWFDLSTFKEPYRTEGKKIMGYELAEAFDWELPDVILYPTGGGTGLVGMWKAFAELAELGWLNNAKRPRMISVQAAGCAPVVKAFDSHAKFCDFWLGAKTIASGLRVPKSFADQIILHDIHESDGLAIAVTDEEITIAQKLLGEKEGIFSAPEGAATFAALSRLVEQQKISQDEKVVCFNTGSGLKYLM